MPHRAVMRLIVILLMSLVVGISTTASAAVRSHPSFEPLQLAVSLTTVDLEDGLPDHPTPADSCHEACSWLVEWHWPGTAPVYRFRPDRASDPRVPGPVLLILPPPRVA